MATQVPPPSKRQKREALAVSSTQAAPESIPDGSIRIRFVDQTTGLSDSLPVLTVPLSQASTSNLNLLLNELKDQAEDRIPYRFYHSSSNEALGDKADVWTTLVKPGRVSSEEEVVLQYAPQAVFRVKAVSRCAAAVSGHGDNILAVQFSPSNSGRMASGSGDKTVRIWDCDTGTPVHTLKGHSRWVLAVSYSPDGSLLASGGYDNEVRIWNPETGKQVGAALKGHTGFITSLCWEPYHLQQEGRPRVASSSKDGTVRIWDAVGGRQDFALTGHKSSVTCVKWGGTGRIYTSSHDKSIKVWDAAGEGTLIHTLSGHAHWVNHLALSTDFVLRTAYHDHTRKPPTSPEEKLVKARTRFETAATFNGEIVERLATASEDCTIFLWTPLTSPKPVTRMTGHQKQINQVCFSPDGTLLASTAWDNHVKLWSARDGKFLNTLRAHVGPVYMACFSADSRLLASCSKDTTLKVWDMRTGKLKQDLPGHSDQVFALDWSPDGERVGSGGADKQIRIWRN